MYYLANNTVQIASYISKICFKFWQDARLLVGHFVFVSLLHSLFALA